MSDSHKSVRLKCLLVGLVAVMAFSAGFWWLTRSVIDRRLVGSWQAVRGGKGMLQYDFRQDGTGVTFAPSAPAKFRAEFAWGTRNGILILSPPTWTASLTNWWTWGSARLRGAHVTSAVEWANGYRFTTPDVVEFSEDDSLDGLRRVRD